MNDPHIDDHSVHDTVREGYAKIARDTSAGSCGGGVSCCGSSPQDSDKLAKPVSSVDYSVSVNELAAMGAAVVANCEPCLKHHYRQAQQLGVSKADMARAVETPSKVKDWPHRAIRRLADRLTGSVLGTPADPADPRCGSRAPVESAGKKCGAIS